MHRVVGIGEVCRGVAVVGVGLEGKGGEGCEVLLLLCITNIAHSLDCWWNGHNHSPSGVNLEACGRRLESGDDLFKLVVVELKDARVEVLDLCKCSSTTAGFLRRKGHRILSTTVQAHTC